MSTTTRRRFLDRCTAGLVFTGAIHSNSILTPAAPLGMPIGFQLYSVREEAAQNFPGTLQEMASVGYRTVELCSFAGYGDFKPLADWKAGEVLRILKAAGMHCESCHYTPGEFRDHLSERIDYAGELGLKYMILSSFGLKRDAGLEDWQKAADGLNLTGEKIRTAGMQLGFHNHNTEFQKINGVLIYDELMKRFDPRLVRMQFQCAVVSLGYDPVTFLNNYPQRFCSLHLADWSSAEQKMVALGKGFIDWPRLFKAAGAAGVQNYYVEMNPDLLRQSVPYLQTLSKDG